MKTMKRILVIALAFLTLAAGASAAPKASAKQNKQPAKTEADKNIERYLKFYSYDHSAPLNVEEKQLAKTPAYTQYRIVFESVNKEKVAAFIYIPNRAKPPYRCIIAQHGYGMDKSMGGAFAGMLAPSGYAVVAIDIEYHGERKEAGKDVLSTDVKDDARALSQTVLDLMRTVDYLKSRGDIDMGRIGYVGVSLGSFLGAVFNGVDNRVASVILIIGGGDWEKMIESSQVGNMIVLHDDYIRRGLPFSDFDRKMDIVEPLNFVGRIAPRPLLMLNCSNDKYVPKATAEELYAAARDPKKIEWEDACAGDSGHIPPMDKAFRVMKKWFGETME